MQLKIKYKFQGGSGTVFPSIETHRPDSRSPRSKTPRGLKIKPTDVLPPISDSRTPQETQPIPPSIVSTELESPRLFSDELPGFQMTEDLFPPVSAIVETTDDETVLDLQETPSRYPLEQLELSFPLINRSNIHGDSTSVIQQLRGYTKEDEDKGIPYNHLSKLISSKHHSLKAPLKDHYKRAKVLGLFTVKEEGAKFDQRKKIDFRISKLGHILVRQPTHASCGLASTIIIHLQKGLPVPVSIYSELQSNAWTIGMQDWLQSLSSKFNTNFVYQEFTPNRDNTNAIKDFIRQHGVSAISSGGHIKVIEGYISYEPNPLLSATQRAAARTYFIIADPLAFHEIAYDLAYNEADFTTHIDHIFTFIPRSG